MHFVDLDAVAEYSFQRNPIIVTQYPTLEVWKQHLRAWGQRVTELGYSSSTMGVHVDAHREVGMKSSRPMKNGEWNVIYSLTMDFINEYWKRNPRFR